MLTSTSCAGMMSSTPAQRQVGRRARAANAFLKHVVASRHVLLGRMFLADRRSGQRAPWALRRTRAHGLRLPPRLAGRRQGGALHLQAHQRARLVPQHLRRHHTATPEQADLAIRSPSPHTGQPEHGEAGRTGGEGSP